SRTRRMAELHSETALVVGVPPRRRRGGPGGPSGALPRDAVRALPLLPAIVLLAVFMLGPVVSSFYGAFTNASLRGAAAQNVEFVGLRNFTELFADPDFPKSVLLTLVFLIGSAIIGQNVLGMILALAMRSSIPAVRRT